MIPIRQQSALHRPHENHLDVGGAAVVSKRRQGEWGGGRVQAIDHHHHTVLRFTWYSVVYISLQINTLLCYTLVSVLVLGIGIARGQNYLILDIGWLAWYRSNPTLQ